MGKISVGLVLLLACLQFSKTDAAIIPNATRIAPRFAINLDLPPKQRWIEVVTKYHDDIQRFLALLKHYVPSEVLDLLAVVGLKVETAFPYPYNYEILGIAESLKDLTGGVMNIGDVILANTLYEVSAFSHGKEGGFKACTSIVAQSANGNIVHGRNLDYSFASLFRNMTITVDFQRGGNTVYTGTTFAGYVGLMTGQKPYGYTISLNERDKGQAWMNGLEALANGMGAIASHHIRDVLANEEFDYEHALVYLADKPLIAPCYIIIGGTKPFQGAVITRDRMSVLDFWKLHPEQEEGWFVLETNYDHWTTPPASDDRRDPGMASMRAMGQANVTEAGILGVLSKPPVLNDGTTFTAVMSAAKPESYTTWIREIAPPGLDIE